MKNITNKALCALMTLAIIAPAYGMSKLTQGFKGYHVRKAVNSTLAARLFNRTQTSQGFKATELPVQASPAQAKPGFFSKWLASVPLIGWMWQSNEEQWAKELLKQPAIKDTLTSPSWNPNNPDTIKYVLGKCITRKMEPQQCGQSVQEVQKFIEQERLNRLEKLNKEFNTDINKAATQYTKGVIKLGCKNKDGVEIALTEATDEQIKAAQERVEKTYFPQCQKPEIQNHMCTKARNISFEQLKRFCIGAQAKTPLAATQTPKN